MNSQSVTKIRTIAVAKEATANSEVHKPSQAKVFSAADMWNIQRQRKMITRRWVA